MQSFLVNRYDPPACQTGSSLIIDDAIMHGINSMHIVNNVFGALTCTHTSANSRLMTTQMSVKLIGFNFSGHGTDLIAIRVDWGALILTSVTIKC